MKKGTPNTFWMCCRIENNVSWTIKNDSCGFKTLWKVFSGEFISNGTNAVIRKKLFRTMCAFHMECDKLVYQLEGDTAGRGSEDTPSCHTIPCHVADINLYTTSVVCVRNVLWETQKCRLWAKLLARYHRQPSHPQPGSYIQNGLLRPGVLRFMGHTHCCVEQYRVIY